MSTQTLVNHHWAGSSVASVYRFLYNSSHNGVLADPLLIFHH